LTKAAAFTGSRFAFFSTKFLALQYPHECTSLN
jgi:hypothetical protein